MVLIAILILVISASVAAGVTSTVIQREKESELLFRGMAYWKAIRSYYRAQPQHPAYPRSIEDLLLDPRFVYKRHLRKAYEAPVGEEWRLIRVADGRIAGVAVTSQQTPLTHTHFPKIFAHFGQAKHLSEWEFIFLPNEM